MKNTSKYLGKHYDGWCVVDRIVDKHSSSQGTHSTFVLHHDTGRLMTLSDREMTKLNQGKSIQETIKGKDFCYDRNINTMRNTIKHI